MQDHERCSLEEFQGRWARVQAYLKDEGLAALFAYSQPPEHKWSQIGHVGYLSGFDNYDRLVETAVVVPATGHPVVPARRNAVHARTDARPEQDR